MKKMSILIHIAPFFIALLIVVPLFFYNELTQFPEFIPFFATYFTINVVLFSNSYNQLLKVTNDINESKKALFIVKQHLNFIQRRLIKSTIAKQNIDTDLLKRALYCTHVSNELIDKIYTLINIIHNYNDSVDKYSENDKVITNLKSGILNQSKSILSIINQLDLRIKNCYYISYSF